MSSANPIYSGQVLCSAFKKDGQACGTKAYFLQCSQPRCGRHTLKTKHFKKLPKDPNDKVRKEQLGLAHEASAKAARDENSRAGRPGTLRCGKLFMMKTPVLVPGFRNVLPNYRAKESPGSPALCMPDLSPKSLGPVHHGQPGLPPALSIENYHQFNKVFPCEVDARGDPLPEFYSRRLTEYLSDVPKRHKFDLKVMQVQGTSGNKNIPLFSVHVTPAGSERRYTYVQSRYFYSHQYELLAKQRPSFQALQTLLKDGWNLNILGYDGYDVPSPDPDTLMKCYLDHTRPFGHELVLYSLLAIPDPVDYPWNKFYANHRELYE